MFTPPPSPLPGPGPIAPFAPSEKPASPPDERALPLPLPTYDAPDRKRRIGRRLRWIALVVPCVLILITASTRYVTHPAAFDLLADASDSSWADLAWTPHKRHPQVDESASSIVSVVDAASLIDTASLTQAALAVGSASSASSTTALATTTGVPTVPADPVLPTPFPQPFDSDITQNYSSVSCFNFFNNMTNTEPFRRCRAFSLLWQSSSAFIGAQANATLMNALVWGTCNTPVDTETCSANMKWFAGELQSACAADLKDGNTRVKETLTAIRAYDVMRDAACLVDATSGAYCFVNAVSGTDAADKYAYNLPLGLPIPSTAAPTCSSCAQDVFKVYAEALQDSDGDAPLDGLQLTYEDAVETTNAKCGQSYATAIVKSNAARGAWSWSTRAALAAVAAVLALQ